MSAAIEINQLGKRYFIEHASKAPYQTLRESIRANILGIWQPKKEKESFWALKDVSFEVMPGEILGVIGRNGAGKSTLLKILSRVTKPTTGEVLIRGRMSSLLEIGTGFHPELTGRENLFLSGAILGMSRAEVRRKFDAIVNFAEVEKFLDTPVKRYSSGMYVRLAFAVAAHLDPEILIVDEVLAVGDDKFQKKCLGKVQEISSKEGRTVLIVSHNMGTITSLCSRALLLERGRIAASGDSTEVVFKYHSPGLSSPASVDFTGSNRIIGDSFVQLLGGSLCDEKGKITADFLLDDEIHVSMKFHILQKRNCREFFPYPAFHFYSGGGECAFYASLPNRQTGMLEPGIYTATCRVPAHFLNTGTYYVGFGFAHCDPDVRVSFYEPGAVSFQVREDMERTIHERNGFGGMIPGLIRYRLNWTLRCENRHLESQ